MSSCGKFEEKEREIGYKGIARIDHLLAANRLSEAFGMEAASYAGWPTFPPPEKSILIAPMAAFQNEGSLGEISAWMEDGGHLIAFAVLQGSREWERGREEEGYPFDMFLEYYAFDCRETTEEEGAVFEVSLWENDGEEGRYETNFESPLLIRDLQVRDSEYRAVGHYSYGKGSMTVLASAEPFTNQEIGKAEHASLFGDLIQETGNKRVWLVYSARLSFFVMLWDAFPAAILALGLFVLLLIWWAWKGFGPRFHRTDQTSAQLKGHIQASGHFFHRHGADRLVLGRMQEGLIAQLARKMNMPFDTKIGAVVTKAGEEELLTSEEISALQDHGEEKQLVRKIEILQRLEKIL